MLFTSDGDRHSGLSKKEFFASWTGADGPPPALWCDMVAGISSPPDSFHEHAQHPVSTLEAVTRGDLLVEYRGKTWKLEAGNIIFLAAGEYNRLNYGKNGCSKIFLAVTGTELESMTLSLFGGNTLFRPPPDIFRRILEIIDRLTRLLGEKKSVPDVSAEIFRLMMELSLSKPDTTPAELSEARNFLNAKLAEKRVLPALAQHLRLSAAGLGKLFRDNFQTTPSVFLIRLRMEKAANLLKNTSMSVKEIGAATGYGSGLTFAREFKKHYGLLPLHFRKGMSSGKNV